MHWDVQREKGSFCSLSDTWVGVESGKHKFFNSHTQKKKKKSLRNPQTRSAGAKPHFQERKHGKIQERYTHEKEEI